MKFAAIIIVFAVFCAGIIWESTSDPDRYDARVKRCHERGGIELNIADAPCVKASSLQLVSDEPAAKPKDRP